MSDLNEPVNFNISKKALLIIGICVAVIVLGIVIWQTKFYATFWRWIMPADITVTVTDASSQAISEANVKVESKEVKTDSAGKAVVKGLAAKKKASLQVTAIKYKPSNQTITLKRGHNASSVKLEQDIRKVTVAGKVTNYVTGEEISGYQMTNTDLKAKIDDKGTFSFNSVPVGEFEISVTKDGFLDKTEKVTVDDGKNLDIKLVPEGRVIFVSNRENEKRGIFSCDYDGGDVQKLITREGETEDYNAIINNDKTMIAFLSTRDNRKDKNNQTAANLYTATTKGANLKKISEDFNIHNVAWSADGEYLGWVGRPSDNDDLYKANLLKNNSNDKITLNQAGNTYLYYFNHSGNAVIWAQTVYQGQGEKGLFHRNLASGDTKKITDASTYGYSFTNNDQKIRFSYHDDAANLTKNVEYEISSGAFNDYSPSQDRDMVKIKSPDGKKYAYASNRDGKTDIYISNIDGENEQRLTTIGTVEGSPDWDLTSQYVLFNSAKTGETAKYIVGIAGGDAKKITDIYLYANWGEM